MNHHDFYVHVLGVALLIGLGFLSLGLEDPRLRRRASLIFAWVLGLLLADAAMHLLPNAMADFIFGSRHRSISNNLLDRHSR